jgi:predicted ester cyclase
MKKYLFTLIAFSFLVGASCQQKIDNEKEMKALTDKELEAWNNGNLSMIDETFSGEGVMHIVDSEDLVGIQAKKDYIVSTRTSFPDFNVTFDEIIIKGDKIVLRWTATGTNTGPYGELPPTGNKIKFSGALISHVVDGKISEQWQHYNQAANLTQLGFTITPPVE